MYSFYLGYLKSLWQKGRFFLLFFFFCYTLMFLLSFVVSHIILGKWYFCSDVSFIVPHYCDDNMPLLFANEFMTGVINADSAYQEFNNLKKLLGLVYFFPFLFAGNLFNFGFTFLWFLFFLLNYFIIKLPIAIPDEEISNTSYKADWIAQKFGHNIEFGWLFLFLIPGLFIGVYGKVGDTPYFISWGVIFLTLSLPFGPIFLFQRIIARLRNSDLNDLILQKLSKNKDILESEESLVLEFKTSFQTSYPNKPQQQYDKDNRVYYTLDNKRRFKSEKEIEKLLQSMVLESVVGFLNSIGGQLVIGINEKDNVKKIVGIEYEGFASEDEYDRHITQQIINRIGKNFLGDYIHTSFKKVEDKTLFILDIKAFIPKNGQIPALLDGTKCYKRTGARTDPINEGAEFANFVASRIQN